MVAVEFRAVTDADDGDEGFVADRLAPEDAFELVADETRVRILETLADADQPLSFSTLRERAAVEDPGRFNYHLGKLVGTFVHESPDGYELGLAGLRVVGAILSGSYTQSLEAPALDADAACPQCDAAMEARFEGEQAVIACPACDLDFYRAAIPPGALAGREPETIPQIVDRYQKRRGWSAALGFCTFCDGPLAHDVRPETVEDAPDGVPAEYVAVTSTCQRCGVGTESIVEAAVLTEPEVVGFHAEHGIDLRSTPLWELPWLEGGTASVVDDEPLRVRVPVRLGDDLLELTLDGDVRVVETVRS